MELGVGRLWLFGTAVRDDFVPETSKYDFLVGWSPDASHRGWAAEMTQLEERLSGVLGAGVNTVETTAPRNSYFDAVIEAEKVLVYGDA